MWAPWMRIDLLSSISSTLSPHLQLQDKEPTLTHMTPVHDEGSVLWNDKHPCASDVKACRGFTPKALLTSLPPARQLSSGTVKKARQDHMQHCCWFWEMTMRRGIRCLHLHKECCLEKVTVVRPGGDAERAGAPNTLSVAHSTHSLPLPLSPKLLPHYNLC